MIWGNTISTSMLRSDYNETDPGRSSFILNKPTDAINKAQRTADEALEAAEAALPKTGGAISGNVDFGGNKLSGLADPTADGDAVNQKSMVEFVASMHRVFTLEVPASGWSADAPYTQTIAVEGILETDMPHYGVVYTGSYEAEKDAFTLIDDLDTTDGHVTFTCFDDKPTVDLTIQLEVNR